MRSFNFENLFDLPAFVFLKDKKSTFISCNERTASLAGINQNDIKGRTDFDMCWKKFSTVYRNIDQQVIQTNNLMVNVEKVIFADNQIKSVLVYKAPMRNHLDKVIGLYGIAFILDQQAIIDHFPPHLKKHIETFQNQFVSTDQKYTLTNRQIDCLYYLAKGMQAKQIANELQLSTRTIEHYLKILKIKFDCYSRSDLIQKALEHPAVRNRLFTY